MGKSDSYEDIIHLPHHQSTVHPQMPRADRAAQFSPFAALTGHEAAHPGDRRTGRAGAGQPGDRTGVGDLASVKRGVTDALRKTGSGEERKPQLLKYQQNADSESSGNTPESAVRRAPAQARGLARQTPI